MKLSSCSSHVHTRDIDSRKNYFFLKVQAARDEMQWGEEGPPPLLVKIAPDLSKEDLEDIAAVSICTLLYFLLSSSQMPYNNLYLFVGCLGSSLGWTGISLLYH